MHGKVKWFSERDGYGFIVGDDGGGRYFNVRGVNGTDLPHNGDTVSFSDEDGKKGLRAVNVALVTQAERDPGAGRVTCRSCGKAMVPRLITYAGVPQNSLCPFCGRVYANFVEDTGLIDAVLYVYFAASDIIALFWFKVCLVLYEWGWKLVAASWSAIADFLRRRGWTGQGDGEGLNPPVKRQPTRPAEIEGGDA